MKPTPASWMQRPIASGAMSILTPSATSTSAAPVCEDSPRLPCLATGTPLPAMTKADAVEMLTLCELSPPVPTMSMAPSGASTRSILARMVATAPEISLTVSPRTRSAIRKPPIWPGVASPDMMMSKASRASSKDSALPVATLAIWVFSALILVEGLGNGGLIDADVVLRLQLRHQLVEQVVRHAGGEGFLRIVRHRAGIGSGRLEHFGDLEQDLSVAGGRGDQPGAAFADAEHRGHAFLAEIDVVGLALHAALGLLLELQFAGDHVERRAVLEPLLRARPALAVSRLVVSAAVQSATTLWRTSSSVRSRAGVIAFHLVEDEAVVRRGHGRVLGAGFGLEHRLDQFRRLRQVVDDGFVRPLAGAVDRVDGDDLQLQLGGGFAQRCCRRRGYLRNCRARPAGCGLPRPAPDPCGSRADTSASDFTTSGLISVTRSSTGPKAPWTTGLTSLALQREGRVGDRLVGDLVLGQRAEQRVGLRSCLRP